MEICDRQVKKSKCSKTFLINNKSDMKDQNN